MGSWRAGTGGVWPAAAHWLPEHPQGTIASVPPADIEPTTAFDVPARPATVGEIRSAYVDTATVGYTVYAVGAVAVFIALALSLSDAETALHASVFAAGIVVAGAGTDRLDRRMGTRPTHVAAYLAIGIASVALAWAPAFTVTLAAAGVAGIGTGVLTGHANRTVSAAGGALARTRLARASLAAMFASLVVPLVIVGGETTVLGWRAFVIPLVVLVVIGLAATARFHPVATAADEPGSLPTRYWTVWLLASLVIGIEVTTVVWSGSLIEARTGVALADAAVALAAFIVGIIVGRSGLGVGILSRRDPVVLMRLSIVGTLIGAVAVWISTAYFLSVLALFVAGLGIGVLFPLAASTALALASAKPHRAAARLVLGVGVAILVAPFLLGLTADLSSIEIAWAVVPILCLGVLGLTVPLGRAGVPV